MTPQEILMAVENEFLDELEGINPSSAEEVSGYLSVSDLVAIPVSTISPRLNATVDIELVDDNEAAFGTLCLTKRLGSVPRNVLTKWQYVAFLCDSNSEEVRAAEYAFKSDYVVVDRERLEDYERYFKKSAPIWGGFSHGSQPIPEAGAATEQLRALRGVRLPTNHHEEALRRYVSATNPFDRYLRLYHCLELLFDFVIFAKVKALGNNLQGFSQLLSEHGRTELDRLKAIMKDFCDDPQSVADSFKESTPFRELRYEIFQAYSKSGNPIADETKWEHLVSAVDEGRISPATWKEKKLIAAEEAFAKFSLELCAYWIYRVRSSIAHSRVGEYLLEDRHSDFVLSFAEPMLLNVVVQVFSSERLGELCD